MDTVNSLTTGLDSLPHVPLSLAEAYRKAIPELVEYTNAGIFSSERFNELTGGNPSSVIKDNHRNHAMFMSNVFTIGDYNLLARTLPWVYRAYMARGFSENYFPEVVRSFIEGVTLSLSPEEPGEIITIYRWILNNHAQILHLSQAGDISELAPPTAPEWLERKTSFLRALMEGDSRKCLEISAESVGSADDIDDFYIQVIQPSMYEIGALWENNEISVAQEHLASAIVTRTIGSLDAFVSSSSIQKKRVVVTASSSEFHEIGAWMVSDHFEYLGWQVRYLGANTPISDLISLLEDFKPSILALSVTMSFNLASAEELIRRVRENDITRSIRVLIGGRVFNENPGLWKTIGANGYAADLTGIDSVIGGWDEPA